MILQVPPVFFIWRIVGCRFLSQKRKVCKWFHSTNRRPIWDDPIERTRTCFCLMNLWGIPLFIVHCLGFGHIMTHDVQGNASFATGLRIPRSTLGPRNCPNRWRFCCATFVTRKKSGDHQLRLVNYSVLYKVLFIPGGAGFLPSTVVVTRGFACRFCKKWTFVSVLCCITMFIFKGRRLWSNHLEPSASPLKTHSFMSKCL